MTTENDEMTLDWTTATILLVTEKELNVWCPLPNIALKMESKYCNYHWATSLTSCSDCKEKLCTICTTNHRHKCTQAKRFKLVKGENDGVTDVEKVFMKRRCKIIKENGMVIDNLCLEVEEIEEEILNPLIENLRMELRVLAKMLLFMEDIEESYLETNLARIATLEASKLKCQVHRVVDLITRIVDEDLLSDDDTRCKLLEFKQKAKTLQKEFCDYDSSALILEKKMDNPQIVRFHDCSLM